MNSISKFHSEPFINALKAFFEELNVPVDYLAEEPASANDILEKRYKPTNEAHQLIDDVYALGIVNDAIFKGKGTFNSLIDIKNQVTQDYDGLLLFGVTLKSRANGLPITRSHLAEITRAFNRTFPYTPVTIIFKYNHLISFANSERIPYKQEWREGEKVGKIAMLKDINIHKPHTAHLKIIFGDRNIPGLRIDKKKTNTFQALNEYWRKVLNTKELNKDFYNELFKWYLWAKQQVRFPNSKNIEADKHSSESLIRFISRILFVWFMKEKGLISTSLFDQNTLKSILKDFKADDKQSNQYYTAILQNLFFATLNMPVEQRSWISKNKKNPKQDGNPLYYRYEDQFLDAEETIENLFNKVPFLNGGLFDCLDDKKKGIVEDGFTRHKKNQPVFPNHLFFGDEEQADISEFFKDASDKNKWKAVKTKGIISLFEEYKFTIEENTPLEEDIALDPELLGKVFENLLASYNPETKTTARKQTGSFYTPREIVNYMVDESLIAYLKNAVSDWNGMDEETIDQQLHALTSFDESVPFGDYPDLQRAIINALSSCTILDPACGSGAFPMGILQKMVHILQKLDPENKVWKEVQLEKAELESKAAFEIEDKQARGERLQEINEAFDQSINDPDYARKLFLIENCIYGVDIQPIATQISKLRFFISLVVEQKVNPEKANFGIRPLPNLETKFVAANTLIGIDKPSNQTNLFDSQELRDLENQLKQVRSKLFGARTKETKLKYRELDKSLRDQIAERLKSHGWQKSSAEKLAGWDPYDQNASSSFFDPEWMFDIKDGFDVVIGNPPYVDLKALSKEVVKQIFKDYKTAQNRINLYSTFIEKGIDLLNTNGILTYINPNSMLVNESYEKLRELILPGVEKIIKLPDSVFENATVETIILISRKQSNKKGVEGSYFPNNSEINFDAIQFKSFSRNDWFNSDGKKFNIFGSNELDEILEMIELVGEPLEKYFDTSLGITPYDKYKGHSEDLIKGRKFHSEVKETKNHVPLISGKNLTRYYVENSFSNYLSYGPWLGAPREERFFTKEKIIIRQIVGGNGLRLIASYSNEPHYFTQIGFSLVPKKTNSNLVKTTLGLLNSTLISFYHKQRFLDTEKIVFQKVLIANAKKLPLKLQSEENVLILLVNLILHHLDGSSVFLIFDSVIDSIVFNLYFPDHMKERGIDVLEFVERDLEAVMQGREFEALSDPEKEAVIEKLHVLWSDPENEVVKRMGMFKERSPEILRVILES